MQPGKEGVAGGCYVLKGVPRYCTAARTSLALEEKEEEGRTSAVPLCEAYI